MFCASCFNTGLSSAGNCLYTAGGVCGRTLNFTADKNGFQITRRGEAWLYPISSPADRATSVSTGKRDKARPFMSARRYAMDARTRALFHFDERIEQGGFRQRIQEGDISGSGDNHEPGGMPLPGIHCSLVPVPPLYISYVVRDSTWPS